MTEPGQSLGSRGRVAGCLEDFREQAVRGTGTVGAQRCRGSPQQRALLFFDRRAGVVDERHA
jgi:hypothetical protein